LREDYGLRVFENRMLRRVFVSKRDQVTGEWRRLRNKELCALYFSPNIIRVMKLRRMGWARHVTYTRGRRDAYMVLVEDQREGDHLEDRDIDGRIL
jgi:hypothetical protein